MNCITLLYDHRSSPRVPVWWFERDLVGKTEMWFHKFTSALPARSLSNHQTTCVVASLILLQCTVTRCSAAGCTPGKWLITWLDWWVFSISKGKVTGWEIVILTWNSCHYVIWRKTVNSENFKWLFKSIWRDQKVSVSHEVTSYFVMTSIQQRRSRGYYVDIRIKSSESLTALL